MGKHADRLRRQDVRPVRNLVALFAVAAGLALAGTSAASSSAWAASSSPRGRLVAYVQKHYPNLQYDLTNPGIELLRANGPGGTHSTIADVYVRFAVNNPFAATTAHRACREVLASIRAVGIAPSIQSVVVWSADRSQLAQYPPDPDVKRPSTRC